MTIVIKAVRATSPGFGRSPTVGDEAYKECGPARGVTLLKFSLGTGSPPLPRLSLGVMVAASPTTFLRKGECDRPDEPIPARETVPRPSFC